MSDNFSYSMRLDAKGKTAKLRFIISIDGAKQDWRCTPGSFLSSSKGTVEWKGRALGMFPDGGSKVGAAYAVLEIPSEGLDSVAKGEGSSAWFVGLGEGTWTLTNKNDY